MGRAQFDIPLPVLHIHGERGGVFRPLEYGKGGSALRRNLACGALALAALLTGCSNRDQQAQEQGVLLRGQYQAMTGWSGTFQVCAQLGEQVYEFTMAGSARQEGETVLTVVEPAWMAGVTARMSPEETVLEYDGAGMTLGTLNGEGLSPIAAVPELLEQVSEGYIAQCSWAQEGEDTFLALTCRDPEREQGEGTEYTMWFDPDTFELRMAEVQVEGVTVLTMTCDDFTLEMSDNESTDHENLGGDSSGQSGA